MSLAEIEQLTHAFTQFKPANKLRKREEILDEQQWRLFFDDVRLAYLKEETIDRTALDRIYENVRK